MSSKQLEYIKLSAREAVLHRPDVYVGSNVLEEVTRHLYTDKGVFDTKKYSISPVFLKLFDEIATNSLDATVHDASVRKISVYYDKDSGFIHVSNDGAGIPVTPFKGEEAKMVPEVIFSSLHSGSNFVDEGTRTTGGKNGVGCVLVNIWSTKFNVDIHDSSTNKTFYQAYADNMSVIGTPVIKHKACKKGLVHISYCPDYARLGLDKNDPVIDDLLRTRTLEISAVSRAGLSVDYNGTVLVNKISKYITLLSHSDESAVFEDHFGGMTFNMSICLCARSQGGAECVGFVNGVNCSSGTHMRVVNDRLVKLIQDGVTKRYPKDCVKIRLATVKEYLTMVVRATIGDPTFASQTKECLTTSYKNFGFAIDFSSKFVNKLNKSEVVDKIYAADFQSSVSNSLKKTKQRSSACFVDKYDPALRLSAEPEKCTLILCEGDSAKALVVSGVGSQGRDYFGIFPLKGVPLNARTMARTKVFQNTEIQNVLKILNIQPGNKLNDKNMRYGSVAIFADSDLDGRHIVGLVINFFMVFFPDLIKSGRFLKNILSPIIRVRNKRTSEESSFLTLNDFNEWKQTTNLANWTIRYLKGLGSSTSQEAKAMFRPETYQNLLVSFQFVPTTTERTLEKFFDDKSENILARKQMIMGYNPTVSLDVSRRQVTIDNFLEHDLIHFSSYSVQRAIPCVLDGCAHARRKILYYFLQKAKPTNFEKVAQAGANCAASTNYHHGETSLIEGVVGLAQDYVGAGNAPYLDRQGQFGSRLQGGKDHAAARYIFTRASALAQALFKKADYPVLSYREDEGMSIEPVSYVPVLPVVLLNGAAGIGTGFSTYVPCFLFEDILAATRACLHSHDIPPLVPGYLGYSGKLIPKEGGGGFISEGVFERIDDFSVRITELPLNRWTEVALTDYKHMADPSKRHRLTPVDIINRSSDMLVNIELRFLENIGAMDDDDVCRILKLRSSISTNNMYLFDANYTLCKYESIEDIVAAHAHARRALYENRKTHELHVLSVKLRILEQKVLFIKLIIDNVIALKGQGRNILIERIAEQGLHPLTTQSGGEASFDHLLSIAVSSFTEENIAKMQSEVTVLKEQIDTLTNTSIVDLWEADLREAESAYAAYEAEFNEKCTPIDVGARAASSKVPRKRKPKAAAAPNTKRKK